MKLFLSNYQKDNKNNNSFIESNQTIFEKTVNIIYTEIGERAFKTTRSINKSICDSLMVAIAQTIIAGKELKNIKENYQRLIHDDDYKKHVTSGTSGETSVKGRIDLARNYFLNLK